MTNETLQLKEKFEALYPEYARRLSAASEDDIHVVYKSILAEKINELKMHKNFNSCCSNDYDYYTSIALKPEEYTRCVQAQGDGIEAIVKELMNRMDVLKKCADQGDKELFAAQLYASGLVAITPKGFEEFTKSMKKGEKIALAVVSGVVAVGLFTILGVLEIFILAIFTVIFYMKKPAMAVIALINELEDEICYDSQHFNHGDRVGTTAVIPEAFVLPSKGFYNLGFFTGSKLKDALYGVQGAYTLKNKSDGTKFAFGFDCPLTGLYVDNNCYCAIDKSAEEVCEKTDKENAQEWTDGNNKYGMSIKCNSPKGSYAYYIARIYNK